MSTVLPLVAGYRGDVLTDSTDWTESADGPACEQGSEPRGASLLDDLMTLLVDDHGRSAPRGAVFDAALAAAVLGDLVVASALRLDGEPQRARVLPGDLTSSPHEECGRIVVTATGDGAPVRRVLRRTRTAVAHELHASAAPTGERRPRVPRISGRRWPAPDPARREIVVGRLLAELSGDEVGDPHSTDLVALLVAVSRLNPLLRGLSEAGAARAARHRAEQIAAGSALAVGLRDSVGLDRLPGTSRRRLRQGAAAPTSPPAAVPDEPA